MSDQVPSPPARSWANMLGGRQRAPLPPSGLAEAPAPAAPAPAPERLAEAATPAIDMAAEASTEYRAFTVDRVNQQRPFALEIRYFEPRVGIEEGYLLSMPQFVQAHFIGADHVILHFAHTVFEVEGRGIRALVELLKQGTLQTIQEWSARRWPEPPADQPKITRITAITPEQVLAQRQESARGR